MVVTWLISRAGWLKMRPVKTAHHALHLFISCLIYSSSTVGVSKESDTSQAKERDMLSRWFSNMADTWDWSVSCVPLSVFASAVPPLAISCVCRHSISASLEAKSCCSSDMSACGERVHVYELQ